MAEGVLILDKPAGMTSHDAVNKIRRLYGTKQVGHTGTLDPMATGVLCVLIGRAVKASEYEMTGGKQYRAGLRLGLETDTEDIWGTETAHSDGALPSREEVLQTIRTFVGDQMQIPPMVSALKRDGQKLADLARKGITVEREPRPITIDSIEVGETGEPDRYELTVSCSKGTYIRTLCADIGRKLGCGGVMDSLRRLGSGGFSIENAVTLEALEAMTEEERAALLLPVEQLFQTDPAVLLPAFFARLAHCGAEIYQEKIRTAFPNGTRVRLCDGDGFFALGEVSDFPDGSAIRPIKQFRLT